MPQTYHRYNNAEGFDVILATPERVLVSQHRPDAEGLISILKCLKFTIDLRRDVAFDGVEQTIPGSTTLFTADQMDDLHWFFSGFHTKRVAGGQKLSEVGDSLTVMPSVLCTACLTISVRKKMAAIKFEIDPSKKLSFEGGFWLSYQDPLHSERG
jgi:hypothetical protein